MSYSGCDEYFFFKPIAVPNGAVRGKKALGLKVLMQFPSSEFCQTELEILYPNPPKISGSLQLC